MRVTGRPLTRKRSPRVLMHDVLYTERSPIRGPHGALSVQANGIYVVHLGAEETITASATDAPSLGR